VLALAAATYIGGRVVGTYELYLVALSLTLLVVLSGVMVVLSGRKIGVRRQVYPAEPLAGDEAALTLELHNDSFLPTAAVQVTEPLGRVAGEELVLDMSPLGPKGARTLRERIPGLRRGVYLLDSARVTLVDPLGLFSRRRPAGDELRLTVLPRLVPLTSCVFFGGRGLGQNAQTRSSLSSASLDLRGVRPHHPGEPLSRIDWKSTAKTGILMLKETEEPSRTDVVVLLDGTAAAVTGEPPLTSFERAVEAAGSIADFILREGFGVSLLLHEDDGGLKSERFDGRERGRKELLEALAATQATARVPLADALRRKQAAVSKGLALVVVAASFDRSLLLVLAELREQSLPVYLVHVNAPSFAGLPVGEAVETERRRFLLGLQAAGVPSVSLGNDDDLVAVLSFADRRGRETGGAAPVAPPAGVGA
jgi:uncharacterized protein (DUF58 family)